MQDNHYYFLLELLISPQERQLLARLRENPDDKQLRNVYVDFLEENGRLVSANLVRHTSVIPGFEVGEMKEVIKPFEVKLKAPRASGQLAEPYLQPELVGDAIARMFISGYGQVGLVSGNVDSEAAVNNSRQNSWLDSVPPHHM